MSDEENQKREVLTAPEKIALKKSGTSESLRVPASWRRTIPALQGPLLFEARVEKDENGRIYVVFEKVRE